MFASLMSWDFHHRHWHPGFFDLHRHWHGGFWGF